MVITSKTYERNEFVKQRRVNKKGLIILSVIVLALLTAFMFAVPRTATDSNGTAISTIAPAAGGLANPNASAVPPDVANQTSTPTPPADTTVQDVTGRAQGTTPENAQ